MSPSARASHLVWLLPVLLVVVPSEIPAQAPAPVLTLRPAVEVSMPTEPGKLYQMQVSGDLTTWQNHGTPIFGTGNPVVQPMAAAAQQFFRLQVLTAPVMGDAPWTPEGSMLQLNEGTRTLRYEFQPNNKGFIRPQSGNGPGTAFTWTWLREDLSRGRAEITIPASSTTVREIIQFSYIAPRTGQFARRVYKGAHLENSNAGSFGPASANVLPLVPAVITGRPMAFSEFPTGNALTLTTTNAGLRLMDGSSTPFGGSWLVTGSNTARLSANYGSSTQGEEYRFTFTGPYTGQYTRQTFTEGVFRDEDQGTFCLGNAP